MIGINLNNIPCLIHEGKVISEYFPMLKYLCRKFNRTDLFGRTIQHEVKFL